MADIVTVTNDGKLISKQWQRTPQTRQGVSGNALTLDASLEPAWITPSGGGGSTGARYPVQEAIGANASTGSQTATLSTAPTNGNLLILCSYSEGGTNISSITQTNVTWTKVAESTASVAAHAEIWKGVVAASAGTGITVTYSGTTYCGVHVSEWASVTGTLDGSAGHSTDHTIPLVTPSASTNLVIFCGAESTYGGGFSPISSPQFLQFSLAVTNSFAMAFAFPGKAAPMGYAANSHGGTYNGVTVSLS